MIKKPLSLLSIGLVSLVLAGCGERPLSTFDAQSPIAQKLDTMLIWLLVACGVVFVIIQGAVIYMAMRFRVSEPDDPSQVYPDEEFPEQVHGNTRLEIGWTIVPTLIMAVVAFFTLGLYFQLDDVSASDDRQIESVTVVGQQWWWEFQYHLSDSGMANAGIPAGTEGPHIVTAGELVLPLGEEIALDVTSRDVIHSFWVPALNGKRDAVPGRVSPWTIEAGSIGRFPGECTEFCGLSHAYMEKWAIGVEPADWKAWAANQASDAEAPADGTAAAEGWSVFANNCASCHVINGLTTLGAGEVAEGEERPVDSFAVYDGANRLIDKQTQVSGAAPNLTHMATRSTFAGGIFELYKNPDSLAYTDLAEDGVVNRGHLEAWIINAPEQKANAWDAPGGQRGMTPFEALSAEEVDNLVEFLMTLD